MQQFVVGECWGADFLCAAIAKMLHQWYALHVVDFMLNMTRLSYLGSLIEATHMAKMITGTELSEAVSSQSFIKNGVEANVEGVKYDFSLSKHILKAEFGQPISTDEL